MRIWKGSGNVSKGWRHLWSQTIILDQFQVYLLHLIWINHRLNWLSNKISDHLTKLARLEVESILRTLEQPGMYVDGNAASNQSPPVAPARSGSQQGTPSRQTTMSTLMDLKEGKHNPPSAFHPINRPSSSVQVSSSPQVTQTSGMTPLGTQSTQETTLHRPTPMHIVDPAVTAII